LEKDSSGDFIILSMASKKKKEDTTTLKETINQLQGDMEQLGSELSNQGDLIKIKNEQISNLLKQLDQNNGSA
jgi:cob(I)alamin adenosyltransferase